MFLTLFSSAYDNFNMLYHIIYHLVVVYQIIYLLCFEIFSILSGCITKLSLEIFGYVVACISWWSISRCERSINMPFIKTFANTAKLLSRNDLLLFRKDVASRAWYVYFPRLSALLVVTWERYFHFLLIDKDVKTY